MAHNKSNSRLLEASREEGADAAARVRELLSRGAEIECRTNDDETPLMRAAWAGNCDTIRILIDRGAEIDARNWEGKTPLMAATIYGHVEAARALLTAGADAKIVDNNGQTALEYANLSDKPELFSLLVVKSDLSWTRQRRRWRFWTRKG